jgi:hypothetical protein
MTDYIVANCETAALNGTYEYDDGTYGLTSPEETDVWIMWDGNGHTIPDNLFAIIVSDINTPGQPYIQYLQGDGFYCNADDTNSNLTPPDDPSIDWRIDFSAGDPSALTVTAAGGSAQNLTLSCAAGSYSLAGVACTLTYTPAAQNLTLACNAGTLALTGSNATFEVKRNYTLSASAGSYALTGTNVTLRANRPPVANSQSVSSPVDTRVDITLTGSDPDGDALLFNLESFPSHGVLSGFVPNLVYIPNDGYVGEDSFTFIVFDGIVASELATVSITMTKVLVLPCEAGSYLLSGTNATLDPTFHYSLTCGAGSYILTGTDISFGNTKAYTLTCSAGSYTLTGTDVSFGNTKSYELVCGAGSYALTGAEVTLATIHTYSLACNSGSYLLTGTNAALTSARSLACNSGAYTLTGLEADLFKRLVMPCGNGSYVLTGSPATINSARTFALGMGSYVLVGTNAGLYILTATPDCRTYFIDAENRTLLIGSEDRTHTIDAENRTMEVRCH